MLNFIQNRRIIQVTHERDYKSFIFIIFLNVTSLFGQNLVPNPSFEIYDTCPVGPTYTQSNQIQLSTGWNHPTYFGTSDYFNSCADSSIIWTSVNVPNTYMGYQQPYHGQAYAGIYAYGHTDGDYGTEYIQCKLNSVLTAGQNYYISFYVSLADYSEYAISEIGAFFSVNPISRTDAKNFNFIPQVKSTGLFLDDTNNWMLIEGVFEASGGEEYITIGNFKDSITTDTLNTGISYPTGEDYAYYFIDGINLMKSSTSLPNIIPNVFTPNNDNNNDFFQVNIFANEFQVYNRWGQIVFSQKNQNPYWDGKDLNFRNVSNGVYYYVIKTEKKTLKGFVHVIR